MAVGNEAQGRKFITTEPLEASTEAGEQKVWDAVRSAFADRNCIGYWRYPLFSKVGETRKEPDILIADKEFNLIVIEVLSITLDQIIEIDDNLWQFQNFSTTEANPYQQAEGQLKALIAYCDRETAICGKVTGRALVALPLITQKEWQEKGFDQLPNCPPIIFQEHLSETGLLERIQQSNPAIAGSNLDEQQWELMLAVIGGTTVLRKPSRTLGSSNNKTRGSIIAALQEKLYELDFQQEHIGKGIPPGIQRMRGIAGSGKTVLLCQKAAHIHLKHPDWDIALVFFTRTLYDLMIGSVDKWLRHFSGGDIHYDPKTNKKLRVLHAWGAKEQPGLYSTICEFHGIRRKTTGDTREKQPGRGLADLCKRLAEEIEIQPLFDAILIDEGQDLVADGDLKHQDKQAIYWLAYQALRPADPEHPEQRRLIWAYDEAQSLDSLKIPTTKELFGENISGLLTKGGQYPGGIKKYEVMRRCYRTPGPILTAAHAIGMGLLRPEGMLTGITRAEDWKAIGYEVTGKFISGQKITLHRPPHNSPNPIGELWGEPVLEFNTYSSRKAEMSALAEKILHNLSEDELKPSRDILVIVLGASEDAIELENQVANFLVEKGIDIYIPTALELNELKPQWPHHEPNCFWMEGGVTVSRVPRAKGNEANMVYVVGCDNVARNDSDVSLRNQLFIALTRARGWANLSGVGDYPMYGEIQQVMDSGDTFSFTYKRPLKRDIGDREAV
ncbi:nuclease-related domain-containing DEAD/DEAH box helicase [Microcoleus sp. FACHB-68]|uniref:ATP-binding domain-containing protein n=1 Tax=Microcoleus sp. FACHB-68 TaxID=2692826 RepID=UPI0016842F40|nr:nuclease-related domain-containing DEAD/DEAH box helicase [Microcoleus sp. FACHB-68]MBD1938692.1 ATP-binding domain-containing protein [Microcoleus sp. FACHB-68]